MPVWLALVGRLFRTLGQTLARLPPSAHTEYSTEAFPALVVRFVKRSLPVYLAPTEPLKPAIVAGAGMALCQVLTECLTDSMVSAAQSPETAPAAPLTHLIRDINSALKDIRYQAALGAVLTLTEALVIRLGRDSPDLVSDILKTLGEMRDSQAYGPTCAVKENLEGALETAAQAMGIEKFLARLPLNIENELPNEPRRPYLLATLSRALAKPLPESSWVQQQALGSHSLVFYTNTLLPLAQRLLSKAEALWVEEPRKEIEGKLYETLGMQVLGLLPILCGTAPADAAVAFGSLAPVLGEILTAAPGTVFPGLPSQPDLRPLVCDTLHQLARRYVELLSEDEAEDSDEVASESAEVTETLSPSDKAQVEANINAIVQFNDRFLGALCNIYTTPPAEIVALGNSKGQALQALHERQNQYVEKALKSLLQLVSEPSAIESYFVSLVQKLLELQTETKEQEQAMDTTDGIVASQRQLRMFTILDLLLILLPFIADDGATVAPNTPVFMYYQVLFGQLQDSDVGVQKKTYKALQVLLDTVTLPNETLMELAKHLLEPEVLARCPPGSKKSRMGLIQSITTALGASESPEMLLRWIPICLPEVMLASKEVSEKARNAAFDCLVAMGWTMQARGEADSDFVGKASAALEKALEDDEDADSQSAMDMRDQAPRSPIEELFTMVLAGLAGTTAHMQSATIGSIGRLFYEFYDHLSKSFVMDVIDTVFLFLGTKSREILKSALGFMKVVIALCDNTIIEHFLQAMVSRVLSHTKEEKSHFKTKIRHIMERLIRKFGIEKVDVLVPEADRKLILNIRKRRERLKKKKSAGDAGEEKKEEGKQKYEDAIYGSESDLDSDKEESSKAGGHSDDEKYIPESLRDETRQVSSTVKFSSCVSYT